MDAPWFKNLFIAFDRAARYEFMNQGCLHVFNSPHGGG
jgi:hypothetical protein